MITKNLLIMVLGLLGNIVSLFNLPSIPTDIFNSAKDYFNTLLSNLSLLGLLVRPNTLKITAGALLTLTIFKFAYPKLVWLIKKLPFVKK